MGSTCVLDFRSSSDPGAVVADPRGLTCDAAGQATPIDLAAIGRLARGRRVLFAAHGFNVRRGDALRLMWRLDAALAREMRHPLNAMFVGLSWPGDWWLKAVNYAGEAFDAVDCGRRLARTIDANFGEAASVSFLSHSIGARLVLEAAARTHKQVEHVMLLAAAADEDCLLRQHAAATRKATRMHVLSSKRDRVLRYAYPVGDFLSDLLGDGDSPFRAALGYRGPATSGPALRHTAIAGAPRHGPASDFDHNDYLPGAAGDARSPAVISWIAAAMAGETVWA